MLNTLYTLKRICKYNNNFMLVIKILPKNKVLFEATSNTTNSSFSLSYAAW